MMRFMAGCSLDETLRVEMDAADFSSGLVNPNR